MVSVRDFVEKHKSQCNISLKLRSQIKLLQFWFASPVRSIPWLKLILGDYDEYHCLMPQQVLN